MYTSSIILNVFLMVVLTFVIYHLVTWLWRAILIAVALFYTVKIDGTKHEYSDPKYKGAWQLELLPDWKILRNCQNLFDGVQGDKRGKYQSEHRWMPSYLLKFNWMAIRNPQNYKKRVVDSFDIKYCKTELIAGIKEVDEDKGLYGYSLRKATDLNTGKQYYGFIAAYKIFGGRFLMWKFGHKFDIAEEFTDFGELILVKEYYQLKSLCISYAKAGHRSGSEAEKALNRLIPKTGRGIFPTNKEI